MLIAFTVNKVESIHEKLGVINTNLCNAPAQQQKTIEKVYNVSAIRCNTSLFNTDPQQSAFNTAAIKTDSFIGIFVIFVSLLFA